MSEQRAVQDGNRLVGNVIVAVFAWMKEIGIFQLLKSVKTITARGE